MARANNFLDSFDEDELPSGQPIILTSNLVRFEKFLKMFSLLHQKEWKPTMGLITGVAGVGKTIAIAHYVANYPQRPHTGLPGCIKVRVRSRSTPKALAMDIASALGEQPRGRNVYELADEAAMAMLRNDVEMLLLDECDLLNDDSFEVVRHIFAKTGVPIVMVGLPEFYKVIQPKSQFRNRVGLHLQFQVLTTKEIIEVVLPNIVLPRWSFDPTNSADQELGTKLWQRTSPALRVLQDVLQTASLYAELHKAPKITSEIIDEAFTWSESSTGAPKKKRPRQGSTEYERASEERHRMQNLKKNKPDTGNGT